MGSRLCGVLVAQGDDVVCVDDLSTGEEENVRGLLTARNFRMVVGDVSRGMEVEGRFDAVMHLASPASPPDYLARPLETLAVGSEGTRHALEIADRDGARFLLASTSEVYGDPEVHPQREDYWGHVNPVGPRSVYDESKRFAEALTMAHRNARGTDVTIARIFNTYGPGLRMGDGRVVSNFIVQALTGQPLTVYGDGSQTRSLCYVDDMVGGLLALLHSGLTGPVNLGNPHEVTVLDLAREVLRVTGSSSAITHRDLPQDDPTRRRPDISLARAKLGWEPATDLEVGLRLSASYFSRKLGVESASTAP